MYRSEQIGAGKFRGGCDLRKDVRMLGEDIMFSDLAERQTFAPYSLFGGTVPQRDRTLLNPGAQQSQLHGKGVDVPTTAAKRGQRQAETA